MKRIGILALAFIITALAAGCASFSGNAQDKNNGAAGTSAVGGPAEVKYYPTYDSSYKTARNDVADFWFDIPSGWKAVDETGDGEVLTIVSDNPDVVMKMYGESPEGTEEDYYKKLSGDGGKIEDFTFNDQWAGKKITGTNGKVYYVHSDGSTFICFSIDYKSDDAWYQDNADTLTHIAKSLRTRQESFGNIGDGNKITMDDLQLGSLQLNVDYAKLESVMPKPEKVEDSTDDGIKAQTLFYADGTQIYLVDGIVNLIDVISSDYATPRGLKVGDDTARIRDLYGDPDKVDSTHWGYTYDGYELFSIFIKDDKVVEIEMDLIM